MSDIVIRKFAEEDIPHKVCWINDVRNNRFLHYELPLQEDKTKTWFKKIQNRTDRYDAIIEYRGKPVGLIGLLSIENGQAEYYIAMGEVAEKRKGIAYSATQTLFHYARFELGLQQLYLYTELENIAAQRLFEKAGFVRQSIVKGHAINRGCPVDCYYYTISLKEHCGEDDSLDRNTSA